MVQCLIVQFLRHIQYRRSNEIALFSFIGYIGYAFIVGCVTGDEFEKDIWFVTT